MTQRKKKRRRWRLAINAFFFLVMCVCAWQLVATGAAAWAVRGLVNGIVATFFNTITEVIP